MFADSVRMPLKIDQSSTGVLPVAISTIMVSPTARPKPIMIAEKTPGLAVGSTTRTAVCQRLAPSASDAARQVRRHARERVFGDREDDRDDGEAHGQPDHQAVALVVGQAERRREPLPQVAAEEPALSTVGPIAQREPAAPGAAAAGSAAAPCPA